MHPSVRSGRLVNFNINRARRVMAVDYEVLGLQVTVATISGFWFST